MTDPKRPPFIVRADEVPGEVHRYRQSDESMGFDRPVSQATGMTKIGVHHLTLLPGRRTSLPHAESEEEEFMFVVSGEIDLWIDGVLHPMKAGDFVGFPSGTGICHNAINNGTAEAVLLVGGEASKDTNRIVYPVDLYRRDQLSPSGWWEDAPVGPLGPHDGKPHP